jgi:peptidyl-dipeptidase A
MKNILPFAVIALVVLSCGNEKKQPGMEQQFDEFYAAFEKEYLPLSTAYNLAYWESATTGNPEAYQKTSETELELKKFLADTARFNEVKNIKEAVEITDSVKLRVINTLYNMMIEYQIDTVLMAEMVRLSNAVEEKYSVFRVTYKGKNISDNDAEDILRTSANSKDLEEVWIGCKNLGPAVSDDIKKLVKLRNQVAKSLGYDNYHTMSLILSDQDPADVEKIFNELDSLIRPAFVQLKGEIDAVLAKKYNLPADKLMPWHYQNRFFQEAPAIYSVDLDKYYKDRDLVKLTGDYYQSIGMNIEDLLKKSDLFEREGKNQHAFCTHIDAKGDIRVLCNVKSNSYWMNTMLHEYGHAVYDKYLDFSMPAVLREPAHTFTTEAIAMLFGRMASSAKWISDMTGVPEEEARKISEEAARTLRLEQLVFSRWSQVMYRFEKAMYADPDQDLNALWWKLVEEYQMMKKPEGRDMPDWATKIHIATSPCYYHNYQLGELLASQLHYYIVNNFCSDKDYRYQSYMNNTKAGDFLKAKVFAPGSRYYWNEMIEKATGEKLTAKYYAQQFLQ